MVVTSRVDNVTDSAWLVLSSIALVAVVERVLSTIEHMIWDKPNSKPRTVRLLHGAALAMVSIMATTLSLPDDWVRSIVQSLGVGVGFALRESLAEALCGVQRASHLQLNHQFTAYKDIDALKASDGVKFKVVKHYTMSFTCDVNGKRIEVPWSFVQKHIIQDDNDAPSLSTTMLKPNDSYSAVHRSA